MATIKGQNLRVMFDSGDPETPNPCVAASTNCVVHLSAQVQESTTKDNEDDWVENEVVGLNWDVQVDALVIEDEQSSTGVGLQDLTVGLPYQLIFTRTTGTKNRQDIDGEIAYTGEAILSDLQVNSPNQDVATYTAKFTGNGELQETTI